MKILSIRDIEDCQGITIVKEVTLSKPLTKKIIFKIAELGKIDNFIYSDNFKKPFFRINFENFFIKGVEQNCSIRFVLSDKDGDLNLEFNNFLKKIPIFY